MILDRSFSRVGCLKRGPRVARGYTQLGARYTVVEYEAIAHANDVEGAVLVQVRNDAAETFEFLDLARSRLMVSGVVGWIDLEAPDVNDQLDRSPESPMAHLLVGVRHLVEAESDPQYLERDSVQRGLAAVAASGLVFDLLVRPRQLASALQPFVTARI